jgi:SAM-dependent methyltransferase
MTEWYEEWFGEEYLQLYPHRDAEEAELAVALIRSRTGLAPGWRVLDVGCGAGRHARAFQAAGAHCTGIDLSAALLRVARTVTNAPLIRADMRHLPIRPASMDLTVNLFTSFGYFASDPEHASAVAEMASTLRPGGWLVLDFLNADAVRGALVPEEETHLAGQPVRIRRDLADAGRFVRKRITTADGRVFTERVRLFSADELAGMLASAGITVRHRFGDYDGSGITPSSPRIMLMGERR